jgi:kynurenine formamidase
MRIRSFVIAYGLVLAILLFADRRPGLTQHDRYSHVVDLTDGQDRAAATVAATESRTHIIAPGALIPGTWSAGQIPPERLVAPLVVMDLSPAINQGSPKGSSPISLDDIAAWESRHGMIPQGAVIAIRRPGAADESATNDLSVADLPTAPFPVTRDAAMFLVEARYTIGFAVETPVTLAADRALAQQLALHGSYVVEGTARFTSLPATGSLIIVAPARSNTAGTVPVRILAMVR